LTAADRAAEPERADLIGGAEPIGARDRAGGPGDIGSPDPIGADPLGAPDPIAHAAPDAEVAAASLSRGAEVPLDLDASAEEDLAELAAASGAGGTRRRRESAASPNGAGSVAIPAGGGRAVTHRISAAERLLTFLRGSWAELQRVQWPDRRQVIQATGVVIGFVIVAGVFLGVADTLAAKLVDYILK
jgi:preprotein translocase SecE subunit